MCELQSRVPISVVLRYNNNSRNALYSLQFSLQSDSPLSIADSSDLLSPNPPNLLQNLRAAGSSYELFEIVSLKRKEFTAEHVMSAMKRLFHLQKNEK